MGPLHARYRFILLPSFLGLLCYGCSTTVASVEETAVLQTGTTAVPVAPGPTEPVTNRFAEGFFRVCCSLPRSN